MVNALVMEAMRRSQAGTFDLRLLVRVAWSLSMLRILHQPLWDQLAVAVTPETVARLRPHDTSALLFSAGVLHTHVPQAEGVVRLALGHMSRQCTTVPDDALIHTAFTLTLLDVFDRPIFQHFHRRVLALEPHLTATQLAMIYRTAMFVRVEKGDRECAFPARFEELCRRTFASAAPSASVWQRDFGRALRRYCKLHNIFPVQSEYQVHGGYRVDLALPGRVAVEFYGPTHFLWGSAALRTGNTLMRERLLAVLGWTVLSVSHLDWAKVQDNREGQAQLIGNLFRNVAM